ncbi:Alpha/Beta hydrolase protein [Aspergillus heterothallicus]
MAVNASKTTNGSRRGSSAKPSFLIQNKNFSYGEHPRQRLSIYRPDEGPYPLPVVIYFHGNEFRGTDNDLSAHLQGKIGRFFVAHRIILVLASYRLLPDAKFPSGIDDVIAAIRFTKSNIEKYGGNPEELFAMAQNAGGAHLAMALFSGQLAKQDAFPRAVMLQSAPLWYDLDQARRKRDMIEYYETDDLDKIQGWSALGLFRDRVRPDTRLPELYLSLGEWDTLEIVHGNFMFVESFMKQLAWVPKLEVLMGQSHIGYALAVGADGEECGGRIISWIRSVLANKPIFAEA